MVLLTFNLFLGSKLFLEISTSTLPNAKNRKQEHETIKVQRFVLKPLGDVHTVTHDLLIGKSNQAGCFKAFSALC